VALQYPPRCAVASEVALICACRTTHQIPTRALAHEPPSHSLTIEDNCCSVVIYHSRTTTEQDVAMLDGYQEVERVLAIERYDDARQQFAAFFERSIVPRLATMAAAPFGCPEWALTAY
jgi:hypothetical protein